MLPAHHALTDDIMAEIVPPPSNRFPDAHHQTLTTVTSLYHTTLHGLSNLISVTWYCKSFTLGVHGLCVNLDPPSQHLSYTLEIKPWLFWKKQGSKSLHLPGREKKVRIAWDLSRAKFSNIGPEPLEGYFVTISCEHEVLLLLGDMYREALKQMPDDDVALVEATLVSRKEHVCGNQVYTSRAQFVENGKSHDIAIECHNNDRDHSRMSVCIDRRVVVHVKHLSWKFRGNQTIHVDGSPVEVFWDVHDWLFNSNDGHAVFMFQTCASDGKVWMQELSTEGQRHSGSHSCAASGAKLAAKRHAGLHWPTTKKVVGMGTQGFSLLLYAWRNE